MAFTTKAYSQQHYSLNDLVLSGPLKFRSFCMEFVCPSVCVKENHE